MNFQTNSNSSFQPMPNNLEVEGLIFDLLVKDEDFTCAIDQINEDVEYMKRRISSVEDERLREEIDEAVAERMWVWDLPRQGREEMGAQNLGDVMQTVARLVAGSVSDAKKLRNNIPQSALTIGFSAGGYITAGVVSSLLATPVVAAAAGGALGAVLAESALNGTLGDLRHHRSWLNAQIEELQDVARRLHEAREDLDHILSREEDPDSQNTERSRL